MRREDIVLRAAARAGDPAASLEIATRLFLGTSGFARNFKLGLAYLQQEIDKGSKLATVLVGERVPLEILMIQNCKSILAAAIQMGSASAMLKLGIWKVLDKASREEGIDLIRRSEKIHPKLVSGDLEDSRHLVTLLSAAAPHHSFNAGEVLLMGARELLDEGDAEGASHCAKAAAAVMPPCPQLGAIVVELVERAATRGPGLDLPVELVERSLADRCDQGEVEAQYVLGRALAGMPYGRVLAKQIASRSNFRRAGALLLRAADAGRAQAWLALFEIASNQRSAAGNHEVARFFLEKAAKAGVIQAQRKLGALLLREATSLQRAETGVHWLNAAAESGDSPARDLLETLVLPLPILPPSAESSILEKVRAVDAELAMRLALARAFHLTRSEAMNFNSRRDIRPWGVVIPGMSRENPKGRIAPAVREPMKTELKRAESFFSSAAPFESMLVLQKRRTQRRVFSSLAISEEMFFAPEIGRTLAHYGFGRHWAVRAAPLLKELLG